MKNLAQSIIALSFLFIASCNDDSPAPALENTNVNFKHKTTIKVGGEGASEITAYDAKTKKIFIVNVEKKEISIYDITNLNTPVKKTPITITSGSPNSVSIYNGKLAVAIENNNKQSNGKIALYNTDDQSLEASFTVGALPDMVTFSKDGKMIVCANEGEPNKDYTNDPLGSVSIISIENKQITTLDFSSFNSQEAELESKGFRVFGPNATLAKDVEPEYITISDDSKTAWVSLQENNGIAKINLITKTIETIYPLGFKDYSIAKNSIDPSNKDGKKELRQVPVYGMYQPDAITHVTIKGVGYVISANEGDAREYDGTPGFVNEERIKKIKLDPTVFPSVNDYQNEANLGRLKIALDIGDTDNDGDYDKLYSYGARSFSIWSENGNLIYDSGNTIAKELLATTSDKFNDDDKRSDDKGAEPESVEVLNIANQRYILFVGLERTDQVLVYDISNPAAPIFLTILSHNGDEAPEGLLAIPSKDSPNSKDLLIVSNEDSGTVSIYENLK
ncbi:choice-of-anchor I family protein [uncultured Tenacibaculum sp.]|uniref:choice-of-anchor I family protein n=1 Tax=uncultured Tenacibaculum sp. TaxID=174713 RepID=UPI00260D89F8|nr:choice-of-anchor I family protein [uncultured Tenacibaculum sp.]